MSLRAQPQSGSTRILETLHRSDSIASTDSLEHRIESYVRSLKENEREIPKMKYSPFISLALSDIFKAATCCFQSKCCVTEQILVAEPSKNGVTFHSQKAPEIPSYEINQLTNASFFADLYKTHRDFLPYLMASAIAYLPSRELKEFWRSWDPKSTQPLDLNKAIMFRDLLNQAHQVLDEVRLQMMKQDMLNMFQPSTTKSLQREIKKELKCSTTMRVSQGMMPRARSVVFSEDISPAPRMVSQEAGIEQTMERLSLSGTQKWIVGRISEGPFEKERVVRDIQKMSGCTKKAAERAADLVEMSIPVHCSTEELWDAMKEQMELCHIPISCSIEDTFSREILKASQKTEAMSVTDIPVEDFAQILKSKKLPKPTKKFFKTKKNEGLQSEAAPVLREMPIKREIQEALKVTFV